MSQYLILIYEDENSYATADQAVWQEIMVDHQAFMEKMGDAIVGGNALQPTGTATTVRQGDAVTDGPFAETKEALGGYYLIEAPDLDAALDDRQAVPGPVRRGRSAPDHGLRVN